jgi:hypothetical protein
MKKIPHAFFIHSIDLLHFKLCNILNVCSQQYILYDIRGFHRDEIRIVVLWVMMPCSLAGSYQRFGGTYRLHFLP